MSELKIMHYIYKGQGKSDNALSVEDRGSYPMTHAIPKLIEGAKPYYKLTRKVAKRLLLELGNTGEWHHTGLYGKRTNYYNVKMVLRKLNIR